MSAHPHLQPQHLAEIITGQEGEQRTRLLANELYKYVHPHRRDSPQLRVAVYLLAEWVTVAAEADFCKYVYISIGVTKQKTKEGHLKMLADRQRKVRRCARLADDIRVAGVDVYALRQLRVAYTTRSRCAALTMAMPEAGLEVLDPCSIELSTTAVLGTVRERMGA